MWKIDTPPFSRHQSALEADISTPLTSEDAQKHRPATTAAVSKFSIILHDAAHMLPSTVAFISITVAAASTTRLRSSQLGARPHAKAAMASPFKLLLPADRASGAAKKGHFRVRDFAGFFVFTAEISFSFHGAES